MQSIVPALPRTEIFFSDQQDISAIQIQYNSLRFTITNIEDGYPLSHYITADRVMQLSNQQHMFDNGRKIIDEHITVSRIDKVAERVRKNGKKHKKSRKQ